MIMDEGVIYRIAGPVIVAKGIKLECMMFAG